MTTVDEVSKIFITGDTFTSKDIYLKRYFHFYRYFFLHNQE